MQLIEFKINEEVNDSSLRKLYISLLGAVHSTKRRGAGLA